MAFLNFAPMLRKWILAAIDFFYKPFRRIMPLQTFRYAVCGGGNTVWDIFMYYISYHFLLTKHLVDTPRGPVLLVYTLIGPLKAHIAALATAFCFSFPTGYMLNSLIVFSGSTLKRRVQLFRYFILVLVCILLNYIFMILFVDYLHFYPTAAKVLTTVLVVSFSYVTQKNFTFRAEPGGQI